MLATIEEPSKSCTNLDDINPTADITEELEDDFNFNDIMSLMSAEEAEHIEIPLGFFLNLDEGNN